MIDLSYERLLYEIKDTDGEILHLKPPAQGLYRKVSTANYKDMKDLYELVQMIMNQNVENKEVIVSDYSLGMLNSIIKDYFRYWNNEVEKVVFQ